jgi:hypothetical protein
MATQFETVIYIKAHAALDEVARNVFGALGGGDYVSESDPAMGGNYCRLRALGLEATVFANAGEMEDDDFSDYPFGLGVVTTFVDPELELAPAEGTLADYYARLLAFSLDQETATSFYLGGQNGMDTYEIRAFRRNSQYTLDAGPQAQLVYVAERRTVEYDTEVVEDDFEEETAFEDE